MTNHISGEKIYLYPYCMFCGEQTNETAKYPIKTTRRLPDVGTQRRWETLTRLIPFAAHKNCMRRYPWIKMGVIIFAILYTLSILGNLITIGNKPIGPEINMGGWYIFGTPILLYAIWYLFYHNPLLQRAKKSQAISRLLKHLFESKEEQGVYQVLDDPSRVKSFSTEDLINEVAKLHEPGGKAMGDRIVSYANQMQDMADKHIVVMGGDTPRPTQSLPPASIKAYNRSPVLAAVLSFLLFGGGGQIYLGQWKKGLAVIIMAFFLAPCINIYFTIIPLANVFVLIFGVGDAYGVAQKLSSGNPVREWEIIFDRKAAGLATIVYAIAAIGYFLLTR